MCVQGMWNLRRSYADEHDAQLVLTFVGETRVLAINEEEELDEAEVEGFDARAQTLYCGNTVQDQLLQVGARGLGGRGLFSYFACFVHCVARECVQVWFRWSSLPSGRCFIAGLGYNCMHFI